jgi:hypothetical protein
MAKTKWEDLSFKDKALIFNYILIACICEICGCLLFIVMNYIDNASPDFFVGLGCMLTWITLTRYLEHSKDYSTIPRILTKAIPDLIRNLINVIPIFVGFAMLGASVFWKAFRFREPNVAFFTLFSVMNGDEISNTFVELIQIN